MKIYRKYLSLQTSIVLFISIVSIIPLMITGILIQLDQVQVRVLHSEQVIYFGVGIGILVSILGALLFARRIKSTLFGFEPHELAKMWQERNAMLEAVREGILAVDHDCRIVVANQSAVQIFKKADIYRPPLGENVNDYFPSSRMEQVIQTGVPEYDVEINLNGYSVVLNKFPVFVNGQVVGAISTFRDKTELKQLADQLSGIKAYADALRAQTHEFMNKLHVILGMIHIGQIDKLIFYINQITTHYQLEVGNVSHHVKDPVLAGFLLSKMNYAREHDVKIGIATEGNVPIPMQDILEQTDDIITVIGNLIDNAFDAVKNSKVKLIEVLLRHDTERLTVSVKDNGDGISYRIQDMIFEKSFSTKGRNRGYGLFLTKQRLERMGGSLTFKTTPEGTNFIAVFPYQTGGESID